MNDEVLTAPDLPAALQAGEAEALTCLTSASRELAQQRVLQKRVDAKFVAPRRLAPELFETLAHDFRVLLSNDSPWAMYDTLYYDSEEFDLFHAHRRGFRPRHKVRVRHYVERDVCFLETKTKDRYAVTTKHRYERAARDFELTDDDRELIAEAVGPIESLRPAVWLRFPRVSLLGIHHPERITIDLGISVQHAGFQASFEDTCIIELKQARFDIRSPGAVALRELGLRPQSMSKYCVSLSVLGRVERTNIFHPAIRELERMSHQSSHA